MKKILYFLSFITMMIASNSCYDREIIDGKDGVTVPAVTNLTASLSAVNTVNVSWAIPSNIPAEIKRPLSVYMQVYNGNTLEYQISLADEPTSWSYLLKESEGKYRIVVKMLGQLNEKVYGHSDEIYSLGQTVNVK